MDKTNRKIKKLIRKLRKKRENTNDFARVQRLSKAIGLLEAANLQIHEIQRHK